MDIATFKSDYPEFGDSTVFPEASITYWLNIGGLMLRQDRWGQPGDANNRTQYDFGLELFVAHHLAVEAKEQLTAAAGGIPGITRGPLSSEGADGVSTSYDTSAGLELNAGHWNLTVYGTRFIRLARMMGAGPIHVGAGCGGFDGAWPGPPGSDW